MARKKMLEGLDKLNKVFTNAPQVALEHIADALNRGGAEVAAGARALVPVETGDLKRSIHYEMKAIGHGGTTRQVMRGQRMKFDDGVIVFVRAGIDKKTAIAGMAQEFGRRPGGKEPNAWHPGHDARPFMWPAFFALRKRNVARVKRAINKAAKQVVRGG